MSNPRTTQAATGRNPLTANSGSSTAQNQDQPTPSTNQRCERSNLLTAPLPLIGWQTRYLQTCASDPEAQQTLFDTLELLRRLNDHPAPVRFIDQLFAYWVSDPTTDLVAHRFNIRDLYSLLSLLSQLGDQFQNLNLQTDLVNKLTMGEEDGADV